MAILLENKTLDLTSNINLTSKNAVELKLNITEEEANSVINSNARACLDYVNALKNEVRYGGKVYFNFITNVGELKKCEAGVEFSYKVDVNGVEEGDVVNSKLYVENVKVSVINGIATATCALVFDASVEKTSELEYLKSIDGANCKREDCVNSVRLASEDKSFTVEEEFDLNYPIDDVISHIENVKIISALCGIGSVVVSGEIELNTINLQGEEKLLTSEIRVIPFRLEHEISKAMPDLISVCNLKLKDSNLKIVVDKNKNKSTVFIKAELSLKTCLYENLSTQRLVDAYFVDRELSFEKCSKKLVKRYGQKCIEYNLNSVVDAKFDKNTLLIAPAFAKIEQIEVKNCNNESIFQGVIELSVLKKDEAFGVESYLLPFEFSEKTDCNSTEICDFTVTNVELSRQDKGLLVKLNINIFVELKDVLQTQFIQKALEGDEKVVNTSAISVCIPNKGDSLWELSKSLGVSENDILKTNPELEFPLTGEERVVVYRELKTN